MREARQAAEAACLSAAEAHTRARSAESAACQSASHHDRSLRYLADELESLNGLLAILYASADSARDSAREGDGGDGDGGWAEMGGNGGGVGGSASGQSQIWVETWGGAVGGAQGGARVSSIGAEPAIAVEASALDGALEPTIGGTTSIERREEAGGLAVAVADACGREAAAATVTAANVNVDAADDEADDHEEEDDDEAAAAADGTASPGRFGAPTPMMTPCAVLAARDGAAVEASALDGAVEATPQWLRQAASALYGAVEASALFGARTTPSAAASAAAATRAATSSPTSAPSAAATSAVASDSVVASPPAPTEPPTPSRPPTTTPSGPPTTTPYWPPTTTPRWPPTTTPSQPPIVLSPESPAAEEARPPWALHRAPTTAPLPYVQLEGLPFAEALALLASPSPAITNGRRPAPSSWASSRPDEAAHNGAGRVVASALAPTPLQWPPWTPTAPPEMPSPASSGAQASAATAEAPVAVLAPTTALASVMVPTTALASVISPTTALAAEGAATRTPPPAATPSAVVGEHAAPEAACVGVVVGRVPSGVPHPVSETSPLPDGLALPAFLSASLLHPSRRPNGYVPTSARARLSSRGREPFKARVAKRVVLGTYSQLRPGAFHGGAQACAATHPQEDLRSDCSLRRAQSRHTTRDGAM